MKKNLRRRKFNRKQRWVDSHTATFGYEMYGYRRPFRFIRLMRMYAHPTVARILKDR